MPSMYPAPPVPSTSSASPLETSPVGPPPFQKGYSQCPGFDFTDTFAPTAKWSALRAILALAALEDLELESIDISSAFLNGDLEEEVYMEQPEGFHQGAYDDFLQLLKGLYGLRQSPRIWHKKLDKVFQEIGFAKVRCDHSIWIYQKDD